MFGKIEGKK